MCIIFSEHKQPKMELMENEREREEKTLAQINGNDDLEVNRLMLFVFN